MQELKLVFDLGVDVFDLVALAFVILATLHLLYQYLTLPKVKGTYSLSNKHYHHLRSHFVHRVILALDFFLAADLIKLAFAATRDDLINILLIVVIRTILTYFLSKEIKEHS